MRNPSIYSRIFLGYVAAAATPGPPFSAMAGYQVPKKIPNQSASSTLRVRGDRPRLKVQKVPTGAVRVAVG